MEKKLEVNNLTISFRTNNGKVQAVRGINFDLNKGETLAIVGESGSGKSVTSKAILGILAGNSIIEGGEIIYDGKDLLKISEEEFYGIRGDKISMIFQDPLSSLNPIMRIGKQLTEAMLLKGKQRQRNSRKEFNTKLKLLEKHINQATAASDDLKAKENSQKVQNFDKFEYKHLALENEYNTATSAANECIEELKNLIFEIEKNAVKPKDLPSRINILLPSLKRAVSRYVVHSEATRYLELVQAIKVDCKNVKASGDFSQISQELSNVLEILESAVSYVMPNFFAMGYYLTFSGQELPEMPVAELNAFLRKYLDDNFMLDFISLAKEGIKHSYFNSVEGKKEVLEIIPEVRAVFNQIETLDKASVKEALRKIVNATNDSIDRLAIKKDSIAYTFEIALNDTVNTYYRGVRNNDKEQRKYERAKVRYDAKVARGKTPDYKLAPASIINLEATKASILTIIDRLKANYENAIAHANEINFDDETVAMIDYLKAQAAGVVHKVTKSMAKHRAIKLMEEVGIPEPRKRYMQYPFEFSGGMRQRIVIAIALAADPDILICDEPTTALDVTIQAQILELINKLKAERDLSVIFITHDLGVVANMADRIAVMYAGKIVEYGTSEDVFYSPAHPYTWALLSSMPDLDTNEKLEAIPGTPPNMIYPPKGDAFADRNKYAMQIDFEEQPPMFQISETHSAATWLLHPDAPSVEMPHIITDRIAKMKERGGVKHD